MPTDTPTSRPGPRLIGCSLGPGAADLITRRAWAALHGPARWVYPVTGSGPGAGSGRGAGTTADPRGDSFALDIVRRAGLAVPADARALHFPMTRDPIRLARAWGLAARTCVADLDAGRDLLFLVEGDASTYSTFGHLARAVIALTAATDRPVGIEVIPGVSSYQAAAARLAEPLVDEDGVLAVLPAGYGLAAIEHHLATCQTLVLLKIRSVLAPLLDLLERRGLLASSRFVERVGTPEERVVTDLRQLGDAPVGYLSLLIVHNPNAAAARADATA